MNRLRGVLLIAAAAVLSACGGGGGGTAGGTPPTAGATDATVALAQRMIDTATAEDCPTDDHCVVWPVETLVQPTGPDAADPLDL